MAAAGLASGHSNRPMSSPRRFRNAIASARVLSSRRASARPGMTWLMWLPRSMRVPSSDRPSSFFDRLHVLGPRQPHRVRQRRPFTRCSRKMVENAGQGIDRLGHQPLVGHQPDLPGMPLGQRLEGDELLGIGRQRIFEQVVAERHGGQRAAVDRVVRRFLVVLAVAEVRHRLVERIAVDEGDRPAAASAGGAFEGRHTDRRVAVRRKIDRRVAVVHPLVEVVVARHVERRCSPPIDVRGGEAGTHGVADEQMIVRQGALHVEQRATPEALEIEGGSRRIAKGAAGQAIIDAAAAVEMAQEGDCIA